MVDDKRMAELEKRIQSEEIQRRIKPIVESIAKQLEPVRIVSSQLSNQFVTISRALEPFKKEVLKLQAVTRPIVEIFKHHKYVWPETYEFLLKMKVGLTESEIREGIGNGSLQTNDLYYYFTRIVKGSGFDTPSIVVSKDKAKAIDLVLQNQPQTMLIETKQIEFDDNVPQLIIDGMPLPLRKNSDRYMLCKFMFGSKTGKKIPWELEDLVSLGLGNDYDSGDDWYSIVYGKIRRLNEAIEKHVGHRDFIIPQNTMFTVNTPYLYLVVK